MKIAGHTMGTPELTLNESAQLYSDMGFDAIEIIFQDGYKCGFNWKTTDEELNNYKELFDRLNLRVSCIVSYASDYNSVYSEKRSEAVKDCRRCIDIASQLSAKYIRIYGGTYLSGDTDFLRKRKILVETMRTLADEAMDKNVSLVVENHFNTMTTGPEITAEIVNEIDRPNVGILYDQANICFMSGDEYEKCIELQKDKIFYVHVKDLVLKDTNKPFTAKEVTHVSEEERTVRSVIVGEGIIPWDKIIRKLKQIGYDGYLSIEYERRWLPNELPIANIGMKKSLGYLRKILKQENA